MSAEENTTNAAVPLGRISREDADEIVGAVLAWAANSDSDIPLSRDAAVTFAEGLIQAVITVRNRS